MAVNNSTLQRLLDDTSLQKAEVYAELLLRACDRLRVLTGKGLRQFPALRRWIETDDVLQQAMFRLHRALQQVHPSTVGDFFALAGLQIRRELHDLWRHHFGPQGVGANHHTDGRGKAADDVNGPLLGVADDAEMPVGWDRFHDLVESLPDAERAVVDCLFVSELTQEETAQVLGLSLRTVKRRWQSARIHLQAAIEEGLNVDD